MLYFLNDDIHLDKPLTECWTKQKIINAYDVLKYGKIAINLDPSYDNTYHLLGRLNFELANLSWLERNVASLIYETPPKGSFDKAADYFLTAIKLNSDKTLLYCLSYF